MRTGWLALVLVLAAAAACTAPSVGDDSTGTPTGQTPTPSGTSTSTLTPTPTGSHTATPTPSGSPTPIQTLPPGVPSYAGWVANVKPLGPSSLSPNCLQCHHNSELTFMVSSADTDPETLKIAWFTHLCNYKNAEKQGVQSYGTPTGETVFYYCNQSNPSNTSAPSHPGGTVPSGFCAAVTNWLKTGTSTLAPPDCSANYDLLNSQ